MFEELDTELAVTGERLHEERVSSLPTKDQDQQKLKMEINHMTQKADLDLSLLDSNGELDEEPHQSVLSSKPLIDSFHTNQTQDELPIPLMKEVFGPYYSPSFPKDKIPTDPQILDSYALLKTLFGKFVSEDLVVVSEDNSELARMTHDAFYMNKVILASTTFNKNFGPYGAAIASTESCEDFFCLHATLPETSNLTSNSFSSCENSWLVDLPSVACNRQILHVEPEAYVPSKCHPLVSNEKKIYTPSNVMRWSENKTNYFSNTRLIRWSDGGITLHVGGDVFDLEDNQAPDLSLLTRKITVFKETAGIASDMATVFPERHLVCSRSTASSVDAAVSREDISYRAIPPQQMLPYSLPEIPLMTPINTTGKSIIQNDFVRKHYEQRKREMKRREKEGNPMTVTEQLAEEKRLYDIWQQVQGDTTSLGTKDSSVDGGTQHSLGMPKSTTGHKKYKYGMTARERRLGTYRLSEGSSTMKGRSHSIEEDYDGLMSASDNESLSSQSDGNHDDSKNDEWVTSKHRKSDMSSSVISESRMGLTPNTQLSQNYDELISLLQNLLGVLSVGSSSVGAVQGTIDFIREGAFSNSILQIEIPAMLNEIIMSSGNDQNNDLLDKCLLIQAALDKIS